MPLRLPRFTSGSSPGKWKPANRTGCCSGARTEAWGSRSSPSLAISPPYGRSTARSSRRCCIWTSGSMTLRRPRRMPSQRVPHVPNSSRRTMFGCSLTRRVIRSASFLIEGLLLGGGCWACWACSACCVCCACSAHWGVQGLLGLLGERCRPGAGGRGGFLGTPERPRSVWEGTHAGSEGRRKGRLSSLVRQLTWRRDNCRDARCGRSHAACGSALSVSAPSIAHMSPTPSAPTGAPVPASEANESIRRFVRARRGMAWSAQDMAEYAVLLEIWTLAVRSEVTEVVEAA